MKEPNLTKGLMLFGIVLQVLEERSNYSGLMGKELLLTLQYCGHVQWCYFKQSFGGTKLEISIFVLTF